MDLTIIRNFVKKVQELDTLFQEMQTLKQQEIGLKLLTSLLKRNETRLGGRFKMKTVIWYNMKDFEKLFDMCYSILFATDSEYFIKDKFNVCLSQFSISDYDIVKNLEEIVRKLAVQFDTIEMTLDYNDENSILESENDSNDYMMGIDVNYDLKDCTERITQYVNTEQQIPDGLKNETDHSQNHEIDRYETYLKSTVEVNKLKFDFSRQESEIVYESLNDIPQQVKDRVDGLCNESAHSSLDTLLNEVSTAEKHETSDVSELKIETSAVLFDSGETPESVNLNLDLCDKKITKTSVNNQGHSIVLESDSTSETQTTLHTTKNVEDTKIDKSQLKYTSFHDGQEDDVSAENGASYEHKMSKLIVRDNVIKNLEQEKKLISKRKLVNNSKSKTTKPKTSFVSTQYQGKEKTEKLPETPFTKSRNKKIDSTSDKHGHFTRSTNKNFKVFNLLSNRKVQRFKRRNTHSSEDENIDPEIGEDSSTIHSDEENNNTIDGFSESTERSTTQKLSCETKKEYPCSLCEKRLPTQKSVIRHMKVAHDTEPSDALRMNKNGHTVKKGSRATGVKRYRCDACNLTFNTQQCYVKHTQTVKHCNRLGKDGERTYLCQLCGKAYLRKDALKRHEKFHSGEKSHMCQFCGYKCRENHNLKRHIALHFESQRNFICEICGAAFHTKKTMEVHHQFKHSEERNYKCESCDKSFKAKSTLIRHKKVHNQAKENRCWCGSAFKTLYNLRRHMKCTHGSDSKLPSKYYVKTLDCPVKTTLSKTDYLSKAEKQTTTDGGKPECSNNVSKKGSNFQYPEEKYNSEDDDNEPDHREDTFHTSVTHNTSIGEEQIDTNFAYKMEVITRIPTIESFRHIPQPHDTFNTEEYDDSGMQVSDNVQVNEATKDSTVDTFISDNAEAGEGTSDHVKTNVPHFSLYGYPPPYSSSVPQFMYMQPGLPRFEPSVHPPLSYMSYDQLVKIGPTFQTPTVQSLSVNPALDVRVTAADDAPIYQPTAPSLSQDQLRVLHHEIYSRLSQEEITQRLNPNTYHQSLSQIEDPQNKLILHKPYDPYSSSLSHRPIDNDEDRLNLPDYDQVSGVKQQLNPESYTKDLSEINSSEIKLDTTQSRVQFDYTDRKDCALEGQGQETLLAPKVSGKTHLDQSQDDMYDLSIDADYLQSRREMAAESLALMSALTPESAYGGQELNDQML